MRTGILCLCLCAWAKGEGSTNDEGGGGDTKLVKIGQGDVLGYRDPVLGIFEFYGIPYATALTGPNRYKAPLPPSKWTNLLEAKDKGIICPQPPLPLPNYNYTVQEDCLIANVYMPDTQEIDLSVYVYIHGGSFQLGWGTILVPTKLVSEHNIIVVTFNYRVGIHGNLCLGTEYAPGNTGMKDIVALLQWVQENISSFGGNPHDVTLGGFSAGSASVELMMLSKSAEGLFHKVIPESGVATSVFTIQSDPLETARAFARGNNFKDVEDIYALEEYYKTASLEVIITGAFFDRTNSSFGFTPCIEPPSKGAFLVESPVDIFKNGKFKQLPTLAGFSNMEGIIRLWLFDYYKDRMNQKFSDFLPDDLMFECEEQKEEVAKAVKEYYFGTEPLDNGSILAYIDFFSDVMFTCATLREIKQMVKKGHRQIYLYYYTFVDNNTQLIPYTNVRGTPHCAQSSAIAEQFLDNNDPSKFTADFLNSSFKYRKLWANFIKTGRPVPECSEDLPAWPAVGEKFSPHMSLDHDMRLRGSLLLPNERFWEDIYEKHYREPMIQKLINNIIYIRQAARLMCLRQTV